MTKIKKWLCERYLPTYCREEMLAENRRLKEQIEKDKNEIQRLTAYVAGIHSALRSARKITINNRGGDVDGADHRTA